jgi:3-phenylpropionate/trans-cinnamate dioxygenase ferredoxin reductase subunit
MTAGQRDRAGQQEIVIAGAGLAGVRTAQALRDLGHTGPIRLFSEENEHPYDRPPLSKGFLAGTRGEESIRLQDPGDYAAQGIELVLGTCVVGVDPRSGTLGLADGTETRYDRLVVATGARPRPLEVLPASPSVHYLRTAADARRLAAALVPERRVAVIGGGFIGLEVASAAVSLGGTVTVVEMAALPLAGVVGTGPAQWLRSWHAARGVGFRCGVTVADSSPQAGTQRLLLDDGSEVVADVVVVGVGVIRETEWLASAGLDVHHGLVCDPAGRTSRPGIVGAGDVVCLHDEAGCRPIAHWTAAADSATRAAEALVRSEPSLPADDGFFWSDQADLRLQFAGRAEPGSVITVAAGSLDAAAFVVHYTTDGRLTGVFAANSPREFLRGRIALRSARARTPKESTT